MENNNTLLYLYDVITPTLLIPNATNIESTIIQLIASMHGSSTNGTNILQLNCEQNNAPQRIIYGDTRHNWPASLTSIGSHLNQPPFKKLIKIKIGSLYQNRNQKYIYPITVSPNFDSITGESGDHGYKLLGDYFWKNMSQIALSDIKSGAALLHLDYSLENWITKENYEKLHTCLDKGNIPRSNVILTVNSFNAPDVYDSWFTDDNKIKVCNLPYLALMISENIANHSAITEEIFLKSRDTFRPYSFTFKCRRTRGHRIALLYKLHSMNLLKNANWSCLEKFNIHRSYKLLDQDNLNNEIVKFLNLHTPKNLIGEYNNYHNTGATDNNYTYSLNSYFDVCTETEITERSYKSLTEKVFKPLGTFQPVIFFSFPGSLKILKDMGFKTFHPFINEEYDNEDNDITRMNMILSEIERLSNMPINELHNWFWSMKDILVHNYRILKSLHTNKDSIQPFLNLVKDYII